MLQDWGFRCLFAFHQRLEINLQPVSQPLDKLAREFGGFAVLKHRQRRLMATYLRRKFRLRQTKGATGVLELLADDIGQILHLITLKTAYYAISRSLSQGTVINSYQQTYKLIEL